MNAPHFITRYWTQKSKDERKRVYMVSLVVLLYLVHYLVFCIPQPFFIEDAGISFAFARNAAEGEGFVGYPGGERVEGFSNPLWTFLLVGLYWLGIDPFVGSKLMGALFGSIALAYVYGIGRHLRFDTMTSAIAPFMLALSTQFVVWNSSGLENSLYAFLLCGGVWYLLEEDRKDSDIPLSALFFSFLAPSFSSVPLLWFYVGPSDLFPISFGSIISFGSFALVVLLC